MNITFLGTGSILASPKKNNLPYRSCSGIFIELNSNETFLFDIGPGTLTKAQQMGIDTRIHPDYLCISHFHIDHCQDYPALIKSRLFNREKGNISPEKSITVYGPTDLIKWSNDLFSNVTRWEYMSKDLPTSQVLQLKELNPQEKIESKNWTLSCCFVDHYDGIAFRLDAEGKSFVYSGDMGYDERFSQLGKQADIAAIECSFPNSTHKLGKHLCAENVGNLAALGGFKQTIVTHLYPQCEGKEQEIINTITSLADTKVAIAHDFLSINL